MGKATLRPAQGVTLHGQYHERPEQQRSQALYPVRSDRGTRRFAVLYRRFSYF
ncbi:hypothetical protein C7S16_5723 [Burkholderia thailandensis]|uniref:Uncharacterized protein n=1 Tax=Burkholderia thailandensis TaxID=57975 RepID=A0AAW9CPU9_BURTH|nr:hypothetical protein [Burkholderia thailandensis]MDW9250832.1 hypothetical protein [Burkholderia thailandensis]